MECTRTVHLTRAILPVCLIGLLSSITAWAGTFEAPAIVEANSNGSFSYEALYTPGAGEAWSYQEGGDFGNTDVGGGVFDCCLFCQPQFCTGCSLDEGFQFVVLGEFTNGSLVDPESLGIVRTSIGTCPNAGPMPTATPTAAPTATPLPLGAAIFEPNDLVAGWGDPIIIEGYGGTIDTTIVPFGATACMSNSDCVPEEFCKKRPGACDNIGLCDQPPEVCPPASDPVCGCDGNTYDSACEAARAGVSVEFSGGSCDPPTPTPTPTPGPFDCLCEVTNISPNSYQLNNVATGGRGSTRTRKVEIKTRTVNAPGGDGCDPGETSGPVFINLRVVDDTGDVLIDSAKETVCDGGPGKVTRKLTFQGPLNCEGNEVPSPSSSGVLTATATAPGTGDYVEEFSIGCNE